MGIIKITAAAWLVFSIILYAFQGSLIFYPQKITPESRRFSRYEISVDNNGTALHGWFVKTQVTDKKPLVIYYGGNAEEVSGNLQDTGRIDAGAFLFMNYRGYGRSEGRPSQDTLYEDALFIFDHITKKENIRPENTVLMGRSLGSGVAAWVAKNRKVGGVILVTPFDSMTNLAKSRYPIFPVRLLLKHRFDSVSFAHDIKAPAVNIMAGKDQIIPNENSLNLINNWGGRATTEVVERATHNDISYFPQYFEIINDFLESLRRDIHG